MEGSEERRIMNRSDLSYIIFCLNMKLITMPVICRSLDTSQKSRFNQDWYKCSGVDFYLTIFD